MKYIRTKDGKIVDVSNMQEYETDDENGYRVFDGYGYDDFSIYYPIEDIIKQAETIEELCDELVIHNPNNDGIYRKTFVYDGRWETILNEEHAQFCTTHYKQKVEIYGAIWTDKGLIYVAKMNDKGELELL